VLTREQIRDGWVQQLVMSSGGALRALTEQELRDSRDAMLAGHPAGQDLAVFAYGSLIWNPAFHFADREIAHVHGFHRRFCLWTDLGRGTREHPGLMLGLDTGGSCRGVLYTIAAADIAGELEIVWRREMVTGAYRPCWVQARTAKGPRRAIAFLINHAHERYAGRLGDAEIVAAVAGACGPLGACADYLFATTAHLDELGIVDRSLRRLSRLVRARQEDQASAAEQTLSSNSASSSTPTAVES
jgi:glutathione-specific gamma-glutamylcyclotransferase